MTRHVPFARLNAAPSSEYCSPANSAGEPPHTIISVPVQTAADSPWVLIGRAR